MFTISYAYKNSDIKTIFLFLQATNGDLELDFKIPRAILEFYDGARY